MYETFHVGIIDHDQLTLLDTTEVQTTHIHFLVVLPKSCSGSEAGGWPATITYLPHYIFPYKYFSIIWLFMCFSTDHRSCCLVVCCFMLSKCSLKCRVLTSCATFLWTSNGEKKSQIDKLATDRETDHLCCLLHDHQPTLIICTLSTATGHWTSQLAWGHTFSTKVETFT